MAKTPTFKESENAKRAAAASPPAPAPQSSVQRAIASVRADVTDTTAPAKEWAPAWWDDGSEIPNDPDNLRYIARKKALEDAALAAEAPAVKGRPDQIAKDESDRLTNAAHTQPGPPLRDPIAGDVTAVRDTRDARGDRPDRTRATARNDEADRLSPAGRRADADRLATEQRLAAEQRDRDANR